MARSLISALEVISNDGLIYLPAYVLYVKYRDVVVNVINFNGTDENINIKMLFI